MKNVYRVIQVSQPVNQSAVRRHWRVVKNGTVLRTKFSSRPKARQAMYALREGELGRPDQG